MPNEPCGTTHPRLTHKLSLQAVCKVGTLHSNRFNPVKIASETILQGLPSGLLEPLYYNQMPTYMTRSSFHPLMFYMSRQTLVKMGLSSAPNGNEGQDVNSQLLSQASSSEDSQAKPTRKRHVWNLCRSVVLDSWALEIVSTAFSVACFIVPVAVLLASNGKERPNISCNEPLPLRRKLGCKTHALPWPALFTG